MLKQVVASVSVRLLLAAALLLILAPSAITAEKGGEITCSIDCGEYTVVVENGTHSIQMKEFGLYGVPGEPALPGKIVAVAIPPGTEATEVSVRADGPMALVGSYAIAPRPLPRVIGEENAEILKREQALWQANHDRAYNSEATFPAEPGTLVRTAGFRKYNLVDVLVTPFQYHPQSGRLYCAEKLIISVEYTLVDFAASLRPMSDHMPQTERTAREIVLNYDQAQPWYQAQDTAGPIATHDFVIITTETLEPEVAVLVSHEMSKGRSVEVVTVEWIDDNYSGDDGAARIRNFLRENYPSSAWGIRDVLIVGHHNEVPMRTGWVDIGYGKPRTDFYYAELSETDEDSWDKDGDNRYGETSGDQVDFYNEVNMGRIPWSEPSIVRNICEKSVAYEQNNDPSFKKNILVMGAYFWSDTDNAHLMEAKLDQSWMDDWTVTRMYENNSTYHSSFAMDYTLNATNARNVWSSETFAFVNWAGHGSPTSAHIYGGSGEAFIDTADCNHLNNDYPAIIWADSCSNSDTDYNNIGREMLRQGGVGFVGATKVAFGCGGWNDPTDGSSQSCDYWFTVKVTSGEMSQGEAHQWSKRKLYTDNLWYYTNFEMFEWTLWGNPALGMGEMPDASNVIVTGPGPGENNSPEVRVYSAVNTSNPLTSFTAYGIDRFGVNVATGDIDGDGVKEIVTGPGPGRVFGPHVRAFEMNGTPISEVSFLAYGTHKFGVNVACGDVDGDGIDEIITGAGPGSVFGPHIRCFNYDGDTVTPISGISFFAYGTRRWGVNVACGDMDGDGRDEIIAGAGPGSVFGPHVRGFSVGGTAAAPIPGISFLAYPTRHWGVNISCGDVDGDGNEEIITAPGPGASLGAHIRGFDYDGGVVSAISDISFPAYPDALYGATVACCDPDGDGIDEIITGTGPDPAAATTVCGWNYDGDSVTAMDGLEFDAYDAAVTHGVKTAGN